MTRAEKLLGEIRVEAAEHLAASERAYNARPYDAAGFNRHKASADALDRLANRLERELPAIESEAFYRGEAETEAAIARSAA